METVDSLLNIDPEARNEAWELDFLKALPAAKVRVLSPEPQEGPDFWPYLLVSMGPEADDSLLNVVNWLSTRGIGLVLNPQKPIPDFVLTYGMIWNFRERGEFFTKAEAQPTGRFEIQHGQQVWVGAPSEAYLPPYVRAVIKQFFMDQGVFTPKVVMASVDQKHYDLCFSLESLKSPPAHEHKGVAEAISWFLPAHYSVSLISEKVISGFAAL